MQRDGNSSQGCQKVLAPDCSRERVRMCMGGEERVPEAETEGLAPADPVVAASTARAVVCSL